MGPAFLFALGLACALAWAGLALRRVARTRERESLGRVEDAKESGSHRARLQYPQVDLRNCIGCGACVRACPEEGVLELVHGQATVAHGSRCVGHGLCAEACPTNAIAVTLGDIRERDDLPALDENLEVRGRPGLFLAGEVTGFALIRTAVAQGRSIAEEVAGRVESGARAERALDLLIVGAGPAGIACALEAKRRGLRFLVLDQEALGGTVAKYPRRKLVLTQPIELPLHGRLDSSTYQKEELLDLWEGLVQEHAIPLRSGERVVGIEPVDGGRAQLVRSAAAEYVATHVCLALGRRGTPRKLGVPGEELAKVSYSLLDAESYTDRDLLVVGGGDSAVEAAVGLSEQAGNRVTLSYRQASFSRIKSRNQRRLHEAVEAKRLRVLAPSQVRAIDAESVLLVQPRPDGEGLVERRLRNDEVFVLAGGEPPFEFLKRCGVSFAPEDRLTPVAVLERGTGLLRALAGAGLLCFLAAAWALLHGGYYGLAPQLRSTSPDHSWLRPTGAFGLGCGIAAVVCIAWNLLYLLRRSRWGERFAGSLRHWLSYHMVTGFAAAVLAYLHGGLSVRDAPGGHALLALFVLVATGAIGRYLYAYLPKATNGRELALDELRDRMVALSAAWDRETRGFGEGLRRAVEDTIAEQRWGGHFFGRLGALLGANRALRRLLEEAREEAREEGIPAEQFDRLANLARRAHREGVVATHFEEVRAVLATWRYFHRWLALAMVLLLGLHVATALRYAHWS